MKYIFIHSDIINVHSVYDMTCIYYVYRVKYLQDDTIEKIEYIARMHSLHSVLEMGYNHVDNRIAMSVFALLKTVTLEEFYKELI